jgi:hypothetical protein
MTAVLLCFLQNLQVAATATTPAILKAAAQPPKQNTALSN